MQNQVGMLYLIVSVKKQGPLLRQRSWGQSGAWEVWEKSITVVQEKQYAVDQSDAHLELENMKMPRHSQH